MSIEEVRDTLAQLFAGREPSEKHLARCATLSMYRLTVAEVGHNKRGIVIRGIANSGRFVVREGHEPGGEVLWLDRKRRFAVTRTRMWILGEEERDVDMDFTVPGEDT